MSHCYQYRKSRCQRRRPYAMGAVLTVLILSSISPGLSQQAMNAFRVLGQPDFRQRGVNVVEGRELSEPAGIAVDAQMGQVHVYVADTSNHRILGWRDANEWMSGKKADLVLGQPNLQRTDPQGIGDRGLIFPTGLAVHSMSGDLYVADTNNHRVVRFPSPFLDPLRVEPDRVYGQPSFGSTSVNRGELSGKSLNGPSSLAFDARGNLWIVDTLNHRVVRYPAGALESQDPGADLVIGQSDFTSNAENGGGGRVSGSGFRLPLGVAFDREGSMYVSDFANARVLIYLQELKSGQAADKVLGQQSFTTNTVPVTSTSDSMRGPVGLAISSTGSLHVAIPLASRVLIFDEVARKTLGAPADRVLGQPVFSTDRPNALSFPFTGRSDLNGVRAVAVDGDGVVYLADTDNNRVLSIPPGEAAAAKVWGQDSFQSNGKNNLGPLSIDGAFAIAVDYSESFLPIYVSDTNSHRILGWKRSTRFLNGDPADLVIGQPNFKSAFPNVDTGRQQSPTGTSLSSPRGMTVDRSGNLWVADSGNNRILRFATPFRQMGRITADLVLGQRDLRSALSAGVGSASLRLPSSITIGRQEEIFVADTGNNRVLQYNSRVVSGAPAEKVFGQLDFQSARAPNVVSAQTLLAPEGVAVDDDGFLLVADTGANRVLVYPNALGGPDRGASASIVIGQSQFDARGTGGGPARLRSPRAITRHPDSRIVVADSLNNRVLIFPRIALLPIAGAEAIEVFGQPSLNSSAANFNSPDGQATREGLFAPVALFVDRNGAFYVGDTGNSRVVHVVRSVAAVNAGHFLPGVPVAPGSLVALFGSNLASESLVAQEIPLPTDLGGIVVELNHEILSPLLFVSKGQINYQLSSMAEPGVQTIAIRRRDTDELLAGGQIAVAENGPSLLSTSQVGTGQAVALNQNSSQNGATNPAARGSVVQLFAIGQGATAPAVPDGRGAPFSPLARTVAEPSSDFVNCASSRAVCVAIGGTFAEVLFSGMTPGFVGLWQLNVRVPDNALQGAAIPIRIVINGRTSNIVTLAIQ